MLSLNLNKYHNIFHKIIWQWNMKITKSQEIRPEVIKNLCSTQWVWSLPCSLLWKCQQNFGISTSISMLNVAPASFKARKIFIFQYFSLYEQLKFLTQLSWARKKFYNLAACLYQACVVTYTYKMMWIFVICIIMLNWSFSYIESHSDFYSKFIVLF